MRTTIPQILHLYWGKDKPLSWLRWLTVKTFAMLNPDWRVIVWHPDKPGLQPKWNTKEHNHYAWKGEDWFRKLKTAGRNVEIRQADLSEFPRLSEVHRSDLLRWRLLHEIGGFWSDIDIVYFRPMSSLKADMTADALLCWGDIDELKTWQAIGFLAGKPGCAMFKAMHEMGLVIAQVPNLGYQDLGSDLLMKFCLAGQDNSMGSRIGKIAQHAVYPFNSVRSQQKALWTEWTMMDLKPGTIGVHWFAAQRHSCQKESEWHGLVDVEKENRVGGVRWAMQQAGLLKPVDRPVKYSIVMPYMDRPVLLHNTLVSYHHWYGARHDWELVLVRDSKCNDPANLFTVVDEWIDKGLSIMVVDHDGTGEYNPARLFNTGVREATGQYVILTSPEIYHEVDIMSGLDREFANGPSQYVICACQSRLRPRTMRKIAVHGELRGQVDKWIQHGQHRPTGYHFCSAISKEDYLSLGGFDERFAPGFCFDDDDWHDTVAEAGMTMVQADDLITSHQFHDPCFVPDKMDRWNRNKALYEAKHGDYVHLPAEKKAVAVAPSLAPSQIVRLAETTVTVACVLKSGGDFTPEYVSRLRSMAIRNVDMPCDFVCLTDMHVKGIDCLALTDGLPGWWSKIELFKPGIIKTDRVVYFDLDTLILDNIDGLLQLSGLFYGLRPWNARNRAMGQFGSGVMSWKNGDMAMVYESFKRDIHIVDNIGDQAYISSILAENCLDYIPLQDHFPGIHSYKRECRGGPPRGCKVVCFHGRPRVHEVPDRWVREAWR